MNGATRVAQPPSFKYLWGVPRTGRALHAYGYWDKKRVGINGNLCAAAIGACGCGKEERQQEFSTGIGEVVALFGGALNWSSSYGQFFLRQLLLRSLWPTKGLVCIALLLPVVTSDYPIVFFPIDVRDKKDPLIDRLLLVSLQTAANVNFQIWFPYIRHIHLISIYIRTHKFNNRFPSTRLVPSDIFSNHNRANKPCSLSKIIDKKPHYSNIFSSMRANFCF